MMIKMALHLILMSLFIISCTKKQEVAPGYNDPKIPGGAPGGKYVLSPITNLTVDTSSSGQITFKYKIPSLYSTIGGYIQIYRKNCDPNGFASASCYILTPDAGTITDPNEAFKIGETTITTYIDLTVMPNNPYTYWFFIKSPSGWSAPVSVSVKSKANQISFEVDPPKFWDSITWSYGYPVISSTVGTQSLAKSLTTETIKKGGIAVNKDGTVMAVADTDHNRVVIYANQDALKCDPTGPNIEYVLCISLSFNGKMTAIQVLGQPTTSAVKNCAQHAADGTIYWDGSAFDNRYCMNAPTEVAFDGNNLIVADTGNNRILIYKNLKPSHGCEREVSPGTYNSTKCKIDKVVGQRTISEVVDYTSDSDFLSNGEAALNKPQGVFAKDGRLYIADTGNNRVVMVQDYLDDNRFNCAIISSSYTWKTPSCRFSSVLGQEDLVSRVSFKAQMTDCSEAELSKMFDRSSEPGNRLIETKKNFLRRHFASPIQVEVTDNNEIYVAANEGFVGCKDNTENMNNMEIRSRIMYFQNNVMIGNPPQCNNGSFLAGGCDATKIFGQYRPQEVLVYEASSDYQEGTNYGLGDIKSLMTIGKDLIGLDASNNSLLYWRDWKTNTTPGIYRTYFINNPNGRPYELDPDKSLPDLVTFSDITGSSVSNLIYAADLGFSKIYEIKARKSQ